MDEQFASERARLAQVTNKCSGSDDLDYFVKECGHILGISAKLPEGKRSAMDILEFVLRSVVNFKKLNQEPEPVLLGSAATAGGEEGGAGKGEGSGFIIPGSVPLRHAVGAAGLGSQMSAGFHSDAPAPRLGGAAGGAGAATSP